MKDSWQRKSLSELFDVKSSKRVHKSDWQKEGVPFYRAREVVTLAKEGKVDNDLYISHELYSKFTKDKGAPSQGDIIISAVGTLGQCYVVREKDLFYFKDASVLWLEKKANVNSRFIEYSFRSPLVMDQVYSNSMGATVGTLTISRAKRIQIPIPPLEEQKQIVAILDKAFAAIDKAKANIERNIENAQELFQSKLNEIFSQKGDGWVEKRLIDICEVKDGTHDSPKYVDEKDGIPFVTQKNILETGLTFKNTKFISPEDHRNFYRRSNVAQNDLLFSMIGANRGMACIVDDDRTFSIKNVGLIKANENYIGEFLLYYLKSPLAKEYVQKNSSGSAQGFIGLGKLRAFPIPITSIEIQESIVKHLNTVYSNTSQLVSCYSLKLELLEQLKKSILLNAFSGKLSSKLQETP